LDDLPLKPRPFRVFCHLLRRAGKNGRCYPAAATIAASCSINRDTVWKCISTLESAGLLKRIPKQFGQSNGYLLTPPIGGKEGPIEDCQSAENEGLQSAENQGHQSAENKGHKGIHSKESISKNPKEKERPSSLLSDFNEVVVWNESKTLPKVVAMSISRQKELASIRRSAIWQEHWQTGINKLSASSFATGNNDRGWKATFDWFLNEENLSKTIEGNYDDRPSTAPTESKKVNLAGRAK
jgi:hypothetical protein